MKQQKVRVLSTTNKVMIYVVCAVFSFMAGGLFVDVAQAVRPNPTFLPLFLTMGLGVSSLCVMMKRNVSDWMPWAFVTIVFLVSGIAYQQLAGSIGAIAVFCFAVGMYYPIQAFNKGQILLNTLCFFLGFSLLFLQ